MPTSDILFRQLESEIRRQKFGRDPKSLYEPIRYLMLLGGKRLRPLLTLMAYSLYRRDAKQIVPIAAAVETFHNFTLMHDDIMDNAPIRRGKPTVHEKWNVNTAILSGDVMLVKVYEKFLSVEDSKLKTVLAAFNKCAAEVCEGQQWDMEYERRKTVSEAEYIRMIRLKTAVLLGFSLELGAILADATLSDRKALREFGINMGIGFQLKDDLLDAYADPRKFGKQVGGDIVANKKTFLLIQAIAKASGKNRKELLAWLNKGSFMKKEKVLAVKGIYDQLDIYSATQKKINLYFARAFRSLQQVSVAEVQKKSLLTFTRSLIDRQS